MKVHVSRSSTVLLVSLFSLFILAHAFNTWHQATDHAWAHLNTDQLVIGSMYDKRQNPELFERDYVLQDTRSFSYYTPSFLFLVEQAANLVEGDFLKALALLQGPILVLYLPTIALLLWQVTGSSIISIFFTLLSVLSLHVFKDYWDVVGLSTMLARTVALPSLVLATFLFYRAILKPERSSKGLWISAGALIGVTANLNPPSGISFALIIGVAALIYWQRLKTFTLFNIVLLTVSAGITGLPIISHALQSGSGHEIIDFPAFASAFAERVAMVPFPSAVYGRIAGIQPDHQVLIGILWLPMTLVTRLAMKNNQRSWTVLPFFTVQFLYIWLLIARFENAYAGIILMAATFFVWRWWERDEQRELLWLELAASIIFVSYCLPALLRPIWLTLELDSLTVLLSQLPRGARFIILPLLLIGARFTKLLMDRWTSLPRVQVWVEFLAVLSLVTFSHPLTFHLPLALLILLRRHLSAWRTEQPVLFAAWAGLTVQIAVSLVIGDVPLVPSVLGILTALWAWLAQEFKLSTLKAALGALGSAILTLAVLTSQLLNSEINTFAKDSIHALLDASAQLFALESSFYLLVATVVGVAVYLSAARNNTRARVDQYLLVPVLILVALQLLEVADRTNWITDRNPAPAPAYVVGQWAKQNTEPDALLFNSGVEGADLRFWSQRNIIMSFKDLGAFVALSQPEQLAALLARWHRLNELEGDDLIREAEAVNADYIVMTEGQPLSLPVVFRDSGVVVYRSSGTEQVSSN